MSVYVLDVPRFNPDNPPHNTEPTRYVVWGRVDGMRAVVECVLSTGESAHWANLDRWASAERIALYEEMRKAERRWEFFLGKPTGIPGRVA